MNDLNKTKSQLVNELNELRKRISLLEKSKTNVENINNSNLDSEQKYRSIIEQSFDGIILVNDKGIIIEWNPAQERITGIKNKNAIGKYLWNIQYQLAPDSVKSPDYKKMLKHIWSLL